MRGCRSLKDLYDHALAISEPKITPILEGSCRIQGPMDDSDNDLLVDMVEHQPKKRCGKNLLNDSVHKRAVSGTCNVCAAPCSSCMHNERMDSALESNVEAAFPENTSKKGADNLSSVNFEGRPCYKSRMCNDVEHAASEGSNFSMDSSNDSSTGNAESKIIIRIPDKYDTSEGLDMPNKVLPSEAVAEDGLCKRLIDCQSINTQNSLLSLRHAVPEPHLRPVFPCDKEKHVLGCDGDEKKHDLECGDSTSCNSKIKGTRSAANYLDSVSDVTTKQCFSILTNCLASKSPIKTSEADKTGVDTNSRRSGQSTNKSFRQFSGSSSNCSHMEDSKPKDQSPRVLEQIKISSSSFEETEESPSFKPVGKTLEASLEQESSPLVISVPETTDGSKLANSDCVDMLPDNRDGKPSPLKNETSTYPSENAHLNGKLFSNENKQNHKDYCQANIGKSSHEFVKPGELKEENGNSAIKSESLEPLPESNRVSDNHSEPDVFEDDVKVCDICGDAGREDMLAFCSRCSDGAEHTYCMRVMLDKVPEGDWLCEECKFKEQEEEEDKKVIIRETACGMTKDISFNKSHQDFGSSNLGILSKLDNKLSPAISVNPKDLCIVDSKPSTTTNEIKDLHAASESFFDNNEATSTSRKVLDTKKSCILPPGISKSTVKKSLSRENSFKSSDTGKVRAVEVNSANNSLALGTTSTNFDPRSQKVQARFPSPRGSFTRSFSDNLNLKPKHLTENAPHKTKLLNEPPKIDGKKDVMAKSASFKGARLSRLNIDATVKGQCTNRSFDARSQNHSTDKGILERKNSHMSDRPRSSSTLSSITSSKKELKISSRDGKLSDMSETNIVVVTKGLEDTRGSVTIEEMKQQTSLSEKDFLPTFTYEDQRQCRKEHSDKVSEPVIQPGLLQPWQFPGRDMKSKSITSSAPRQAASTTGKILKCQRCNETGHATQSCSIDKVRSIAFKPSGERNLVSKSSKWKETVEAVISKSRFHNRIADQPDRPTFAGASYKKNISDDDNKLLDAALALRNSAPLEGTSGMQESTVSFTTNVGKLSVQNSNKQKVLSAIEIISASSSDTVISSDALNHVSAMQMLTEKVSKNFSPSRISAIPKIPHIWQGSFELHKNGELCNLYDGVQAHLSTSASPKVLEVAGNFPCKLHLEEASYGDSWPSQFLRKPPTEEDIALFFFAADFDSHQRNYTKLVDNMLKKDLVLKGSLGGFELLIFPSTKLPPRSQCWNRFCFLWGVFRRKRTNCSEQIPDFRKVCNLSTSPQGTVRDLTSVVVLAHGSFPQNEKSASTERRSFDLNENSQDDKLIDEANSINHLPSKKQRTCSFSENEPTAMSMPTNDCSKQLGCIAARENSISFPEMSKAKSEDALFRPTKVPLTIFPKPVLEKEKSKDYEVVIDLEAIPCDSCEEKQDEFTPNVQTGNKGTTLGDDVVAFPDIIVRNNVEKLTDHTKFPMTGSASYQAQGHKKGKTKTEIDLEAVPQDPLDEDDVHGGVPSWDARPTLKHTATYTPEPVAQASFETLWKEKDNLLLDHGKEPANKKLKFSYDARGDCDNKRVDYGSPEKFFFPVSSDSLTELKPGNNIPSQLVPLDEDVTHPNIPNLELALGAENERRSQKILPLFLPLANSDHAAPTDCVKNEDDSNLSLSLSFPSPKTESSSRGTKQLLLDKQELSSPFLLFRGVIDSGNR